MAGALSGKHAEFDGNIAYSGKRKVYNADSGSWAAGDILVVVGTVGGYASCKRALAGDAALGNGEFLVAMSPCNAGSYGGACAWMVVDFTHSGTAKDPLYLSAATAGAKTATANAPGIVVGILGAANRALLAPSAFQAALSTTVLTAQARITDPGASGAIPVTKSGVCPLTSAGAETRTIAAPSFLGQSISLIHDTDGGAIVVTASAAINQTGNNTITLTEVNDYIKLEAVTIAGALRWKVVANDGAALSTV